MTSAGLLLLAGAVVLVALAGIGILLWRRRRSTPVPAQPAAAPTADAASTAQAGGAPKSPAAQEAIRQMAKEQRKRRKGTIRGKGGGGSDTLAQDTWSGSDFGGPGI